jgi:hypothetical protein
MELATAPCDREQPLVAQWLMQWVSVGVAQVRILEGNFYVEVSHNSRNSNSTPTQLPPPNLATEPEKQPSELRPLSPQPPPPQLSTLILPGSSRKHLKDLYQQYHHNPTLQTKTLPN